MENDKRYFIAGLFIIVLSVGAALIFMWLSGSERRDDVIRVAHRRFSLTRDRARESR